MERDDLIYAAGFFDGEGCIAINKIKTAIAKHPTYQLVVSVCQNEPCEVLHELSNLYGGSLSVQNNGAYPNLLWQLTSHKANVFLVDILPFLRLKKAEADLAILFQEQMGRGRGYYRLTQEQLDEREKMHMKMRGLKKSGKANRRHVND